MSLYQVSRNREVSVFIAKRNLIETEKTSRAEFLILGL